MRAGVVQFLLRFVTPGAGCALEVVEIPLSPSPTGLFDPWRFVGASVDRASFGRQYPLVKVSLGLDVALVRGGRFAVKRRLRGGHRLAELNREGLHWRASATAWPLPLRIRTALRGLHR